MSSVVAPSLLASDWGRFRDECKAAEDAGADWLHMDVMDGHFVPPITFGPDVIAVAKKAVSIPIDVHLMIESPERQLQAFADAGTTEFSALEFTTNDDEAAATRALLMEFNSPG